MRWGGGGGGDVVRFWFIATLNLNAITVPPSPPPTPTHVSSIPSTFFLYHYRLPSPLSDSTLTLTLYFYDGQLCFLSDTEALDFKFELPDSLPREEVSLCLHFIQKSVTKTLQQQCLDGSFINVDRQVQFLKPAASLS